MRKIPCELLDIKVESISTGIPLSNGAIIIQSYKCTSYETVFSFKDRLRGWSRDEE